MFNTLIDYYFLLQDVLDLASQLTVQVDVYRANLTSFNHIDFIYGKHVKTLINDKVISIFTAKQTLTGRTVCVT